MMLRRSRFTLLPYTTLFRSIPERVVYARGAGAHGYFESYGKVGDDPISKFTRAKVFTNTAKQTPVFVRFSTVIDRKSTRLNSSHVTISYAVFCLNEKRVINK